MMLAAIKKVIPAPIKKQMKNVLALMKDAFKNWGELPDNFIGEKRISLGRHRYVKQSLFPAGAGPLPWLDRPDAEEVIQERLRKGLLSEEQASACRTFRDQGFYIARGLLAPGFVEAVFDRYLQAARNGEIVFAPNDRRYLNPHLKLSEVNDLLHAPKIVELCNLFLGVKANPFQTIGAEFGSGQLEHSDAIHMSTYPEGYLVAAWIACEDIHPDSGPLVYYPGSHRLPYLLSKAAGITTDEFRKREYAVYTEKYEPFVQELIKREKLKPAYFDAKQGDVLFWHHNLIHGGSRVKAPQLTRKSIVCHYFGQGAFCYHDLSGGRADFANPQYGV